MKFGCINNYHKKFRFPTKKITVAMTSSDFADDVIEIDVFDGFSGVPGKNCAATWVFVAWSWLTPHFKARRLLYTLQLHWWASLIGKSHFGAVLVPIIVKIRLKSDKTRQIDVISRHDVTTGNVHFDNILTVSKNEVSSTSTTENMTGFVFLALVWERIGKLRQWSARRPYFSFYRRYWAKIFRKGVK